MNSFYQYIYKRNLYPLKGLKIGSGLIRKYSNSLTLFRDSNLFYIFLVYDFIGDRDAQKKEEAKLCRH